MNDSEKSNPVFDGLPPEVKREFLHKKAQMEARDEEYYRMSKKRSIIGIIVGALSGLIIGPLMTSFYLVFIVFIFTQAGMGYLIADRQWGHLASVTSFVAPPIIISCAAVGFGWIIVAQFWTFLFMLSGWGAFAGTGGALGYWARTRETTPENYY